MAGATDKARFFLEQAVPQLREFEQKNVFSKEEIKTLVKKRSDFEHKVLARGARTIDFARYAAWEINLEQLRAKRCKRLNVKGSSAHAGQARIFSIFHRATRKHPGDLGLWMSYLDFARQVKATNKFKTILTTAIRLHCTKPALWLYAAQWAFEAESDMGGARSYLQRGTRFCTRDKELWIEYARLEMIYLAKISRRRKILGIDRPRSAAIMEQNADGALESPGFASSEDMISIPDFKAPIQPSSVEGVDVDTEVISDPMTTPALNGAIPMAIFDHATKQPFFNAGAAADFFDMFSLFHDLAPLPKIVRHVLDSMLSLFPADPCSWTCFVKQPAVGIYPLDAEFPAALLESLERLKASFGKVDDKARFERQIRDWIEAILRTEELDHGIAKVLRFRLRKLQ